MLTSWSIPMSYFYPTILIRVILLQEVANASAIPVTALMMARDLPSPAITPASTTTQPPAQLLKENTNCLVVGEALAICGSLSPGFTTFLPTAQARCLCYSRTSWIPKMFDSAIAACAGFASTAAPPAFEPLKRLEGFCHQVGDVEAGPLSTMSTNGLTDSTSVGAGFGLASTTGSAIPSIPAQSDMTTPVPIMSTITTKLDITTPLGFVVSSVAEVTGSAATPLVNPIVTLTSDSVNSFQTLASMISIVQDSSVSTVLVVDTSITNSMLATSNRIASDNPATAMSTISVPPSMPSRSIAQPIPTSGTGSTSDSSKSKPGPTVPEPPRTTQPRSRSSAPTYITFTQGSYSTSTMGAVSNSKSSPLALPEPSSISTSKGGTLLLGADSSIAQIVGVSWAMAMLVLFL